ncbi:MAG: DUF2520 domain-containing protein [candidate division KSB1 bacterium]|nr:DUF2520 domain-containing protein [candidate division KSB1 bacterium]
MDTITIIGLGRLGSALAHALHHWNYQIKAVIDSKLSIAASIAQAVKAETFGSKLPLPVAANMVFLCVPDDEIAPIAALLARSDGKEFLPRYAFHCSGALTSDALTPLRQLGVHCASLHPIQSFAGKADDWQKLSNIFFGLEGDIEAVQKAIELVETIQSDWLIVPKENKVIYHIACTIASNYLVAMLIPAVKLLAQMSLPEHQILKLLRPLMETTLGNLTSQGIEAALSGPISRGDVHTIENHLKMLETKLPHFVLFYKLH